MLAQDVLSRSLILCPAGWLKLPATIKINVKVCAPTLLRGILEIGNIGPNNRYYGSCHRSYRHTIGTPQRDKVNECGSGSTIRCQRTQVFQGAQIEVNSNLLPAYLVNVHHIGTTIIRSIGSVQYTHLKGEQ